MTEILNFSSKIYYVFVASVTNIQWFDEDKQVAVAFSDGIVSLCTKEYYNMPIHIEAHEVSSSVIFIAAY